MENHGHVVLYDFFFKNNMFKDVDIAFCCAIAFSPVKRYWILYLKQILLLSWYTLFMIRPRTVSLGLLQEVGLVLPNLYGIRCNIALLV